MQPHILDKIYNRVHSMFTQVSSMQKKDETIQDIVDNLEQTLEKIETVLKEILVFGDPEDVAKIIRLHPPGFTKGAEITATSESPITITEDNNDKFNLEIEATMPDGEDVTIPVSEGEDDFESGQDLVDAIIAGLETAGLDQFVTVEWVGNDTGYIKFTSNDIGVTSYVMIHEPEEHSVLAAIGFDDFELLEEMLGQATLRNLFYELETMAFNMVNGDQLAQPIGRDDELVDGNADFESEAAKDTEVDFDLDMPDFNTANNEVVILVDNPEDNTNVTVKAVVRWKDTSENDRESVIDEFTVSAESNKAVVVKGMLVAEGGKIIISNDTEIGDGESCTVYVQARLL